MGLRGALAFACIGLAGFGFGADREVEALLGQMRKAYGSIESAHLTVKATLLKPKAKREVTTEVKFKRPRQVRETIDGLLSGGKTVTVTSDGKHVVSNGGVPFASEDEDALGEVDTPGTNLETIALWDWQRQLSTAERGNMHGSDFKLIPDEEWNGRHWIVLEEISWSNVSVVRYFIDPQTKLIWRTDLKSMVSGDGSAKRPLITKDVGDFQVVSMNTGVAIDDREFEIRRKG